MYTILTRLCKSTHRVVVFGVPVAASGVKVAKLEIYKYFYEQNQTPNNV
jgi:hypothetical protein